MTLRLLLALVLATASITVPIPRADAGCQFTQITQVVEGGIETVVGEACDGDHSGYSGSSNDADPAPISTSIGEGMCIIRATLLGANPDDFCGEEVGNEAVTPALVLSALQRTPMPPSRLKVQPPNGRTMVNFDTNFYTERQPFTRTLTLLGQRVQLRVFPAEFTWRFDDGDPLTTASPGSPYPDLDVTHRYLRAGGYSPSVDTTYAADWRVDGGEWQRVPGTVTVAGEPVAVEAVEVRPTLVSS
jgi:hypothetical protein